MAECQTTFGIIYKVTNLINGKVYIGQTVTSLSHRKCQHYKGAYSDKPHCKYFSEALRKYNREDFTWEIIDRCNSQNELDEKECYWIDFYQSFKDRTKGYNLTYGGNGSRRIDIDYVVSLLHEGFNVTEIAELTGHHDKHLLGRLSAFLGKEEYQKIIKEIDSKRKKKCYYSFTKEDFLPLIENNFSFHEMADYLNVSRNAIQRHIKKVFGTDFYNSLCKKNADNVFLKLHESGKRRVDAKLGDIDVIIKRWYNGEALKRIAEDFNTDYRNIKKRIIPIIGQESYNQQVSKITGHAMVII